MDDYSNSFVYDLISELRRDPRRRAAVSKALRNLDSVNKALREGKASRSDLSKAQAEIIPASGFNFGFLMGSYFKTYPEDKPLSFVDRPFMFAMTSLAPNSVVTLMAGRQVGKCARGDTEVDTNRGRMSLLHIFESGVSLDYPGPTLTRQ